MWDDEPFDLIGFFITTAPTLDDKNYMELNLELNGQPVDHPYRWEFYIPEKHERIDTVFKSPDKLHLFLHYVTLNDKLEISQVG